nr:lipoprotein [uncultured Gammaproteobacteria bacterium]
MEPLGQRQAAVPIDATEQLKRAQALYRAGDLEGMRQILTRLDPKRLSLPERVGLALLKARLALDEGDSATALELLNSLTPKQIPDYLGKEYHRLRARALTLEGDLVGSLHERIRLNRWLQTPQEVEENNRAILQALELLPDKTRAKLKARPRSDLAGWLELRQILNAHPYRSEALDQAVAKWRETYPYHPADQGRFLERVIAKRVPAPPPSLQAGQTIALLLPRAGPFQAAAEVIRHAIEAARDFPGEPEPLPLSEYDSTAADVVLQYQRAAAQGARVVLGPLQKPELERLANLPRFDPPVLALNAIEGLTRPGLYQFALPPEEGVAQVADSAFAHGHRRALVLVPATPAGDRIARFFLDYWEKLGGRVLEIQRYPAGDVSAAIRRLLNVDESERRGERVRQLVGEVKLIPRVRRDADFIFLQANPEQGRLIKPQLDFYRAEYLPVYATWDVYTGHPDPRQDADLEGVRFCDLPWLLQGEHEAAPKVAEFEARWGPQPGPYLRLAALGMDAYRIPTRLLGVGGRYAGTSGILSVDGSGRIRRQLSCAEFRQGVPVIYGLAPDSLHAQGPRPGG